MFTPEIWNLLEGMIGREFERLLDICVEISRNGGRPQPFLVETMRLLTDAMAQLYDAGCVT